MKEPNDIYLSPLRYPGGKAVLSRFLKDVLMQNEISGKYCEAFAGGAGAALELLFSKSVNQIVLNDADIHIYSFWVSILEHPLEFIHEIERCQVNLQNWRIQRHVYENVGSFNCFQIGFSTFFLNRCNRGGILPAAGPIGGFNQEGKYLIDARFCKKNLIRRIEKIAERAADIEVSNLDAVDFLDSIIANEESNSTFIYLDPPYFKQGRNLYLNFYDESDHQIIERKLQEMNEFMWLVSYDNVPEIRDIYRDYRQFPFDLNYSVQTARKGKELIIFPSQLIIPNVFYAGKIRQPLITT